MRDGWRRCDAEAIDVVRLALAHGDDRDECRAWAVRAATALSSEPVRLGAVRRLADDGSASAALCLLMSAPADQREGLGRLVSDLSKAAYADRCHEERYRQSLEDEEFYEALD